MYGDFFLPAKLSKKRLDSFLAKGWYRMGQMLFTTHVLEFENAYYSAIWLRVKMADYKKETTHLKLAKRNKNFTVNIAPFAYDEALETVHKAYITSVPFELPQLFVNMSGIAVNDTIFDTYCIKIYDNEKLIAFGLFDRGEKSIAGIVTEFDPAYAAFSLGNYLKYLMLDYCLDNSLTYFYPGYFAPGWKRFDYKLTIGKEALEYYHMVEKKWKKLNSYDAVFNPLHTLLQQLLQLQMLLVQKLHLPVRFLESNTFMAEFSRQGIGEMIGHPVFLELPNLEDKYPEMGILVTYNLLQSVYQLNICEKIADMQFGSVLAIENIESPILDYFEKFYAK